MYGKLTYVKGDIFAQEPCGPAVIAHGVNCRGAFGAGIAKQMKERYPTVFDGYVYKFKNDGWKPGDVQFVLVKSDPELWVANMATQDTYGRKGEYVRYDAVEECIKHVLGFCSDGKSLFMPKIGCGLGGGDWGKVEKIIISQLQHFDVDLRVITWSPTVCELSY